MEDIHPPCRCHWFHIMAVNTNYRKVVGMKFVRLIMPAVCCMLSVYAHADELWKHILVSDYIIFGTLKNVSVADTKNRLHPQSEKYVISDFSYLATDPRLSHPGDVVEVVLSRGNDPEAVTRLVGKQIVFFGVRAAPGSETNALYTEFWPFSENVRPYSEQLRSSIEQELKEIERHRGYIARAQCNNDAAKNAVAGLISSLKKGGEISREYAAVAEFGKEIVPFLIYHVNNAEAVPPLISFPAFNPHEAYRIYSPLVVGDAINVVLEDLASVYFKSNHNGGSKISRDQAAKAWNYYLYKTSGEYSYCSWSR